MPRSRQVSHQATVSFMVKAYRISKTNFTSPLSIVTTASHPPRRHDVHRLPLVEHGFSGWPVPQAYIHDCDVVYARTRYRVFFQRHRNLPMNPVLFVHGDLIIMRVGKLNTTNVVNTQAGDRKRVPKIAKRFAPYLARFQQSRRRLQTIIHL